MRVVNETLFRAICLCFSGLMLVLLLLTDIDYAAGCEKAQSLLREIELLNEENASLRERAANQLSLERIERYAGEVLGMRRSDPEQIVYLSPVP